MRRALAVTAPANGSGKTTLLVTLLRAFPAAFTAVKFTTVYRDGRNCPRTEDACACRELHGRYTVVDDPAIVAAPGTDTGRMAASGAVRTIWCLARPGSHRELWDHLASGIVRPDEALLTEGNQIVAVLDPSALVLVASASTPRARWKEDAWDLAARADLVVVNAPAGDARPEAGPAARLAGEIAARTRAQVVVEDVAAPLAAWSDTTLARLARGVLAGAGGREEGAWPEPCRHSRS